MLEDPVVEEDRKFPFRDALAPGVCVSCEPVPETITVTDPEVACTSILDTAAVIVLPPARVTVAAGTPVKTTLLVVADEMTLVAPNVIVTVAALAPNMKSVVDVVIRPPDAVIKLTPVSGPTIDTPYAPEDVIVDEMTVRPVPEAAPP